MPYKDPEKRKWYHKTYSQSYHKLHLERYAEKQREFRQRRREFYWSLLEGKCCVECGESYLYALEFHHKSKAHKIAGISYMVNTGHTKERILEEVEKCEVLCFNCHVKKNVGRPEEWGVKEPKSYSIGGMVRRNRIRRTYKQSLR